MVPLVVVVAVDLVEQMEVLPRRFFLVAVSAAGLVEAEELDRIISAALMLFAEQLVPTALSVSFGPAAHARSHLLM